MSAEEACRRLGVKRATLYTYASRGMLESRPAGGRKRVYRPEDVERLRLRGQAHAGRAPRAAGALRWGEPVLETRVGGIDEEGPWYRGVRAVDLDHLPFEDVAEHLWQAEPGEWPVIVARRPVADLLGLRQLVDELAGRDRLRHLRTPEATLRKARRILARMAGAAGGPGPEIAVALGGLELRAALALTADHGLNASTFAARVTASTGADLYACVAAGLAALSGPRHGTASLELAALLDGRGAAGRTPGFGHPLYPKGDPRARALLRRFDSPPALAGLVEALRAEGLEPNVDAGLLGLVRSMGLPDVRAPLIFAIARTAGWVAHVMEQWQRPGLLRPRASYAPWT